MDLTFNYYYSVDCPQTIQVDDFKTAKVKNTSTGGYGCVIGCYGDGTLLMQLSPSQSTTLDISAYSTFMIRSTNDGWHSNATLTLS